MPSVARHTLFWKYTAWLAGMVSALLVVSGGVGGYFAYRQAITAQEELQREKVRSAARDIAAFVTRLENGMQATADKFRIDRAVDLDDLRIELVALLRHHQAITELRWIGADGRERLLMSRVLRDVADSGEDRSSDPGFRGAHARTRYAGPLYYVRASEPHISLATSHDARSPVLIAEVNLKFVGEVISKVRTGGEEVAYVIDGSGALIAHTDIGRVLAKADLSALPQVRNELARNDRDQAWFGAPRNLAGMPVLSAAEPIDRLGWTMFVEQSRREALRPVYASIATTVVLLLLGIVAAVSASLALARRMVRPIRQIEAGAKEIGEGRLDQRIDVKTGDELEALGVQFNRMAERLQAIYDALEARISERTSDLAAANESKTRFLAAASHDLRQPMHALALFVEQLRARAGSPEAPRLLEKIERSVDALADLLDALLDLSRLDMGAVTARPSTFAMDPLISRLVVEFAPIAESKGLALTSVPTSLWACSDPALLERILLNLITNAIRFTAEGRILVGCRRRSDHVEVIIADTGVGIAAEHVPHVFQEFYQAEPPQGRQREGLGLGLAIVQRLAALLEHKITLKSVPRTGTMISVRLPRASPQRISPVEASVMRDLRGTLALVVDDEAAARDALRGLLAQWGCEVIASAGGDEAIEQTLHRRPDVVLCDLQLAGGESGLDVVNRLQRAHDHALACAFITAEANSEHVAAARSDGYAIVLKPAKPAKLRALIEHLCFRSRNAAPAEEAIR
jgi:signal transduction histidine kinase/ActR/RegA family two-component response regulator